MEFKKKEQLVLLIILKGISGLSHMGLVSCEKSFIVLTPG